MLPFPHAHWYVGAFMLLTVAAFLPSYFAVLPTAPWVHHLHGITASAWILLLMTQNWSAHRRRWRLHVWSGKASLVLLPFFTVGGLLVTQHTLLRDSNFKTLFGEALSIADLIVSAAFIHFYAMALRHRRSPDRHARYMLATVILLAGPSLSRIFANYVPGFLVRSLETLPNFGAALDASFVLVCAFCLLLVIRDYRANQPIAPFSAALAANAAMIGGYYGIGYTETYARFADWFAIQPVGGIVLCGAAASVLASVWGWNAGKLKNASPANTEGSTAQQTA
ncbi:MAG: hypothetical protein AAGJ86_03340 [Pseudomonadota bacterium]